MYILCMYIYIYRYYFKMTSSVPYYSGSWSPRVLQTRQPDVKFGTEVVGSSKRSRETSPMNVWEFPKIRGTLFWGPQNEDPTI